MPAPKTPNTAPGRAALAAKRAADKRAREMRSARVMLREAGHVVLAPEEVAWIRANADASVLTFIRGMAGRDDSPCADGRCSDPEMHAEGGHDI